MRWIEELLTQRRVTRSRVPVGDVSQLEIWIGSGYLIQKTTGRGRVIEVSPEWLQEFRHVASTRLKRDNLPAPVDRVEAAALHGNSKLAPSKDGLCTYFLVAEGAHHLQACRVSEFPVRMAAHGLRSPKVALVENLDVVLEWRDGHLRRLGLEGCDVVLLTRGNELMRDILWRALLDADVAEVVCAFDFDAKGLAFFKMVANALGRRCRVGWPEDVEVGFDRLRQLSQGYDLRGNAPIDYKFCSVNEDALRWLKLLMTFGAGVEQQAFLREGQ